MWPSNVQEWIGRTSVEAKASLAHAHVCVGRPIAGNPVITSPLNGDSYVLVEASGLPEQKLALKATAPPGASRLYWFLDGEIVQDVEVGETAFLELQTGRHRLRCVDDSGRADWVEFEVADE